VYGLRKRLPPPGLWLSRPLDPGVATGFTLLEDKADGAGMMRIGELARATGLNVETIRYYERIGVLLPRGRTEDGYRVFDPKDRERVEFIKQAKQLGLSLAQIKDILAIQSAQQPTCVHVRALLEARLEDAEQALRELSDFRDRLRGLLERSADLEDCRPIGGRICSIIEEASAASAPSVLEQRKPSAGRARREQRILESIR